MTRVLIVDDDRPLAKRLAKFIGEMLGDAEVHIAGSGASALDLFGAFSPDAVIVESILRDMLGIDLCRRIREHHAGRDTLLIIASSQFQRDASFADQVSELHAVKLSKPYRPGEVVNVLRLKRARTPTAPSLVLQEVDLRTQSVARLFLKLARERARGLVTLTRGRVRKTFEVIEGRLLLTSSNQRADSLENFLVELGVVPPEEIERALATHRAEKSSAIDRLLNAGTLSAAQLIQCVSALTQRTLKSVIRWNFGRAVVTSTATAADRARGHSVDLGQATLAALRDTAQAAEATALVAQLGSKPLRLTPNGEEMLVDIAATFGDGFTRALLDLARVEDLSREIDAAAVLPAIEALWAAGCIEAAPSHLEPARMDPPLARDLELSPPAEQLDPLAASVLSAPEVVGFGLTFERAEDSGVIDLRELWQKSLASGAGADEEGRARDELHKELLRTQNQDWYAVLNVPRKAAAQQIEAAFEDRQERFGVDRYAKYELGNDLAKLKELNASYVEARETLLVPDIRIAYDRQLQRTGAPPTQIAVTAELFFREAQRRTAKGELEAAAAELRKCCELHRDQADYEAELGWLLHLLRKNNVEALHRVGAALEIDPDHAAAHEYLGRILTAAGDDERALYHLQRALDHVPPRWGALTAYQDVAFKTRAHRALEKTYQKLLNDLGRNGSQEEHYLWAALGGLYHHHLIDFDAAREAYKNAMRIQPDEATIQSLARLTPIEEVAFADLAEGMRATWAADKSSVRPLIDLFRAAVNFGEARVAFLASAVLVAKDAAEPEAALHYQRYRTVTAARRPVAFAPEVIERVRDPDDDPALAALFAYLEPAIGRLWYKTPLGFPPPPAHVPSAERAFLAARHLYFSTPGRSVALWPKESLKEILLAGLTAASRAAGFRDESGRVYAGAAWIESEAPPELKREIYLALHTVTRRSKNINVRRWMNGVAHTADRLGLLAAGDPLLAARALTDHAHADVEEIDDLLAFALSSEYLQLAP